MNIKQAYLCFSEKIIFIGGDVWEVVTVDCTTVRLFPHYSITYGRIDGKDVISFCEFYKETTEVETAEELLSVERDGISVLSMLQSLKEKDIWIY